MRNSQGFKNRIDEDLSKTYIDSYILRIYKKFIKNGTINSSAIVYNFMKKELRFMVKGMPEDILEKCDKNSLPENLMNTISSFRKNGLIIIICASKLIDIEDYNDLNDYNYYMNDLTFCGFITLKNKFQIKTKYSITELKQLNCHLIINSGDNEYNCLSSGFESGIIDNKNIFSFDIDDNDNDNKIIIRKIYSSKIQSEETEEIKDNICLDKISQTSSIINNNSLSDINPKDYYFKYNNSFNRSSSKNKKDECKISNSSKEYKENKNFKSPKLKLSIDNKFLKNKLRSKNNKEKSILISENSEKERFNSQNLENFPKNDKKSIHIMKKTNSFNSITKRSIDNNPKKNNNQKIIFNYKENQDDNTIKIINNVNCRKRDEIRNNISKFKKFYYYSGIFKDYENLNNNCIYCISGKAFDFLYKNKNKKQYKYLLDKIHKNCKIFYNMSSINKTLLVDFYREYPNTFICNIGECISDIDSILTSNVGIYLNKPNNTNTILFHFYNLNKDILCIKNIIMEGIVLYENTVLLEFVSFLCTLIINSYILCCLIRNTEIIGIQLNFLEVEFLILSILSFIGEPRNTLISEPLSNNKKMLIIYYIIQLIGIIAIKFLSVYIFSILYHSDYQMPLERRNQIFINYFFVLCIEFLLSSIFALNYISIYRKSPFKNLFLKIFSLFIIFYLILLISLNSNNFQYDFFKITHFEFSDYLIDTISDKNRICL